MENLSIIEQFDEVITLQNETKLLLELVQVKLGDYSKVDMSVRDDVELALGMAQKKMLDTRIAMEHLQNNMG